MRHASTSSWLVITLLLLVTQHAVGQADLLVKVVDPGGDSGTLLQNAVSKTRAPTPSLSHLMRGVVGVTRVFNEASNGSRASKTNPLDGVYRLTLADSSSLKAARFEWAMRADVEYAIYNHMYSLEQVYTVGEYNDTHFDSLTHLPLIRALEAWKITRGVPSVKIGVIDTGVFKDHPDLVGQFWVNSKEDLNGNGILDEPDLNGIDDDGNGYIDDVIGYDFVDRVRAVDQGDYLVRDPDASEDRLSPAAPRRGGFGHGTLVSGVVSAALNNSIGIAGVAPGAKLVPIRAFGIDGLGEDDDVAAAIVYAADTGVDVVNLSFGDTYYSPLMADAIEYATSLGTIVVASGGNVGTDAPHYPSDYPDVIGALWLDKDGLRRGSRASFGVGVDVGAPGSFVFTTLMPPPDDLIDNPLADSVLYGFRSGSSLAAPQITGAAGLLRSVDPTLSPASIKAILTSTALDLGEPGWDHETAAGRVDLAAALRLPYPASATISYPEHNSGFAGSQITIEGSVLASLFQSYSIWYGLERDREEPEWQLIVGPIFEQARLEKLGAWNVGGLADGAYILRLEVELLNGQTIEDRRRIYIDRTPPEVKVVIAASALNGPRAGVQVELRSDDLSDVRMGILHRGNEYVVSSDRRTLRHGHSLTWSDPTGMGGDAVLTVEVSNVAGLTTTLSPISVKVASLPNPGYLNEFETNMPAGYLLPHPTDLDGDGLPEVVFNRYREGWLGDTVRVAEWAGNGFRTSVDLLSKTFPRDLGDTDFDGNPEILLQVAAVTQVIEFSDNGTRVEVIFLDTAGIRDPGAPDAAWGSLLTDLDGDGRGEVVVHNRRLWRLFEYRPSGFEEVAQLENPTPIEEARESGLLGSEANGFAEPQALAGDFDHDGRGDLLVNDSDGDFIIFETTGDDTYEAVWQHLTPRFNNRGTRLASGDFDGDGNQEFVAYTHSWPDQRQNGEYDAPYGIYYFFEAVGDNDYRITDSLIVVGGISNHGSITAIDFDGDDADELVIAHPPDLYVLKLDPDLGWRILFHRGDLGTELVSGIRSIAMVPGDFDLNGIPDIIVAGADEMMRRFEWSSSGTRLAPAAWISGAAIDAHTVALSWLPGLSDSVAVFRRMGEESFDLLGLTHANTFTDSTTETSVYALLSYYGSERSALSKEISVRPHDPISLLGSEWREDFLVFLFDGILPDAIEKETIALSVARTTRPAQAAQDARSMQSAESAQSAKGGAELVVRFDPVPVEGDTVFWPGLTDAEGTPVATSFAIVPPRPAFNAGLFLTAWRAVSRTRAELTFNLPLEPGEAVKVENYRIDPTGSISGIQFDSSNPDVVLVDVVGRSLGPTGLQTSLVVLDMTAEDGTRLASEGIVATFLSSAESLSQAYIFPNPYRADQHGPSLMIAGLPNRSTIEIFSSTGIPIRMLEERDGDGGVAWDLNDESGSPVASGVYIILVEAESEESIILKSAIIR